MLSMLKQFNDEMNLIRPMSSEQVDSCAWELIMTSEEDQLAIEDYVIFFKGALQGKYGKILDRLDQQTVFNLLEEYREQRWQALKKFREDESAAHKSLGPTERTTPRDELTEHLSNVGERIRGLKEKIQEQREINRANRL